MELVKPAIGLLFWMTLGFLIVFFILKKFAWKPILNMIREREASIENALSSAEKARLEMKALQADNEKIMSAARETIENQKLAAITELKTQVATLSLEIAEKILKEELSSQEKQKALVKALLDDVNLQ